MHCAMKYSNISLYIASVPTYAETAMVQYSSILICVAKHCFSCVYNCSCPHAHSEPEDASLPEFGNTFTVIATAATVVVVLAIAMVTGVGVIVVYTLKRYELRSVSN